MIKLLAVVALLTLSACGDDSNTAGSAQPTGVGTPTAQEQFLIDNAARSLVSVAASGLQYEILRKAVGSKPMADSTVTVDYAGELIDGTEFDSSDKRGEPSTFPLGGVIAGWVEGLQLMSVGSQYRFVMPSDLAYGEAGAGSAIGPGAVLVFEIDLLEINVN